MKKFLVVSSFLILFSGITVFALTASTQAKEVVDYGDSYLWIDPGLCTACATCWAECPEGAIQYVDNGTGYYQVNPYLCLRYCANLCVPRCPTNAFKTI
ncbi:MAG: 4Fe-4S binding protein [Prevotellaceae bacterium]|jgi:ferredoxin|nr:4Fe-4S binding protein [Prevotellaceae bacterium]